MRRSRRRRRESGEREWKVEKQLEVDSGGGGARASPQQV